MQSIPLAAVSSQTFSATLNGQAVSMALYQLGVGYEPDLNYVLSGSGLQIISSGGSEILSSGATSNQESVVSMFLDLSVNSVQILSGRQCRAYGGLPDTRAPFMLVGRRYLGFEGDLLFVDNEATTTNPVEDPQPSGLGTRWNLLYYTPSDLSGLS